jgi:beta-galactosidase/beta-glucuronidase
MYTDFYETCDQLGIMIFHDFMLSSPGVNMPSPTPPDMTIEATYQARRLVSFRKLRKFSLFMFPKS